MQFLKRHADFRFHLSGQARSQDVLDIINQYPDNLNARDEIIRALVLRGYYVNFIALEPRVWSEVGVGTSNGDILVSTLPNLGVEIQAIWHENRDNIPLAKQKVEYFKTQLARVQSRTYNQVFEVLEMATPLFTEDKYGNILPDIWGAIIKRYDYSVSKLDRLYVLEAQMKEWVHTVPIDYWRELKPYDPKAYNDFVYDLKQNPGDGLKYDTYKYFPIRTSAFGLEYHIKPPLFSSRAYGFEYETEQERNFFFDGKCSGLEYTFRETCQGLLYEMPGKDNKAGGLQYDPIAKEWYGKRIAYGLQYDLPVFLANHGQALGLEYETFKLIESATGLEYNVGDLPVIVDFQYLGLEYALPLILDDKADGIEYEQDKYLKPGEIPDKIVCDKDLVFNFRPNPFAYHDTDLEVQAFKYVDMPAPATPHKPKKDNTQKVISHNWLF